MKKNVIILTAGLVGSSVLTSLFVKSGHWAGSETMKKTDYDTFENADLIALNEQLLTSAKLEKDWLWESRWECVDEVVAAASKLDQEQFQKFVANCNEHQPWIWKDPRLWLTMGQWMKFLKREDFVVVIIGRETLQTWISAIIRRRIRSYGHLKQYYDTVHGNIIRLAEKEKLQYVDVVYEDLMIKPDVVLDRINKVAGTDLSLDHFKSVYRGKLYCRQHGIVDFLKACAIYIKNYGERLR